MNEESPLVEKVNEEGLQIVQNNQKTPDTTPTNVKVSGDVPKASITRIFVQERPPSSFPQRIKKAKEEQ